MFNRSRYGRNSWYMAFFWAFIGFVIGQMAPRISFSLDERSQLAPPFRAHSLPTQPETFKPWTLTFPPKKLKDK